MASTSAKQQVIQNIKDTTNILVTVSADPSVDELSAALGLTLFLNELGKHATAVFSGKVPPAITFLDPEVTFEQTTDSLRDFIIALDKEKADHLRYKVVDDAVKIFITPYRTTITEKDLEFSQGDYNVEMVIALNVENRDHLDRALSAHGKILHDAFVSTVTAGTIKSSLGTADWHVANASGVSEIVVELIDELKTPKAAINEQIATALLTGVVAVTERFSNDLTSSRVMTLAAELMAAGANQRLIAAKLAENQSIAQEPTVLDGPGRPEDLERTQETEESREENAETVADQEEPDSSRLRIDRKLPPIHRELKKKQDDGSLLISHEKQGSIEDVAKQTQAEAQDEAARVAAAQLDRLNAESRTDPAVTAESAPELAFEAAPVPPAIKVMPAKPDTGIDLLSGGVLGTEPERIRDARDSQASTILHHGEYVDGSSRPLFGDPPLNAAMAQSDEPPKVDPFAVKNTEESLLSALKEDTPMLADSATDHAADPRAAIREALAAAPPTAKMAPDVPLDIGSQLSHGLPPMPDFSTLPDLPLIPTGITSDSSGVAVAPKPEQSSMQGQQEFNPSQFQIPGQK